MEGMEIFLWWRGEDDIGPPTLPEVGVGKKNWKTQIIFFFSWRGLTENPFPVIIIRFQFGSTTMQHRFWQPSLGTICSFALIRYSTLYLARQSGFPGDLLTS